MTTATLIVNPVSGRARLLAAELPALTRLLAAHGFETRVLQTSSDPASPRSLAATAALTSALVLACGGDGTVHGVVQGLAHTGVPLGILPLGTADALARNLALPLSPVAALTQLLTYTPSLIPLGEITTSLDTRLFIAMAGCGPDGALAHALSSSAKSRLGRNAYYAHAAHLFFTRRWPAFEVRYLLPDSDTWQTTRATALMASRIPDLGGLFSRLTPLARLDSPYLHVHLLRAPAHLSLPAWLAFSRTALPNPFLTTLDVAELQCTPLSALPVYAQADAEPLGPIPATFKILPAALTLLMPPAS